MFSSTWSRLFFIALAFFLILLHWQPTAKADSFPINLGPVPPQLSNCDADCRIDVRASCVDSNGFTRENIKLSYFWRSARFAVDSTYNLSRTQAVEIWKDFEEFCINPPRPYLEALVDTFRYMGRPVQFEPKGSIQISRTESCTPPQCPPKPPELIDYPPDPKPSCPGKTATLIKYAVATVGSPSTSTNNVWWYQVEVGPKGRFVNELGTRDASIIAKYKAEFIEQFSESGECDPNPPPPPPPDPDRCANLICKCIDAVRNSVDRIYDLLSNDVRKAEVSDSPDDSGFSDSFRFRCPVSPRLQYSFAHYFWHGFGEGDSHRSGLSEKFPAAIFFAQSPTDSIAKECPHFVIGSYESPPLCFLQTFSSILKIPIALGVLIYAIYHL